MVLWKEQLFLADILQSERDFFKKWMFLWGKTERLFIDGHARLHLNKIFVFWPGIFVYNLLKVFFYQLRVALP